MPPVYAQRLRPTRHLAVRRKASHVASIHPANHAETADQSVTVDETGGTNAVDPMACAWINCNRSRRSEAVGSRRRARCQPITALAVSFAAHPAVPRFAQASGAHGAAAADAAKAPRAASNSRALYARMPRSKSRR